MAAATPSPLASTVEKTGAKLCRLLINGGTTVLRNLFDRCCPPANLVADLYANHLTLTKLFQNGVLPMNQWDQLFPPEGATPDSNTFDITLLLLLLTNICGLSPPPSGWHTKPPPSDLSLEAQIARITYFRNELYGHVATTCIDTPTFTALWQDIIDVLVALGLHQADIDKLKVERFGEEDYICVLFTWVDSVKDIKSQLKDVRQYQIKVQQTVDKVHQTKLEDHQTLQDSKAKLEEVHQLQNKVPQAVDKVQRTQEDHQTLQDSKAKLEEVHQVQTIVQQTVDKLEEVHLGLQTEIQQLGDKINRMLEGDHQTLQDSRAKLEEAIDGHRVQLEIAKELGDRRREGDAYGNLGNAFSSHGDFLKAIYYHELQLKIAQELGDRVGEGTVYGNLGIAFSSLGDFYKAKHYHELQLTIAIELGDWRGEGGAYGNLGNAYHNVGNFRKAIECHLQDLNIAQELGDRVGEGRAYANLGNGYYNLGHYLKAKEHHVRHLKIAKEVGDIVGEGRAYANLGNVCYSLGDIKTAINYYEHDLKIAKEVKDKAGIGNACGNLGSAFHHLGDVKTAIGFHERHLRIAKELGDKASEGRAYGNLGIAYQGLGMYKTALEYHERDLHIAKQVGDKAGEGHANINLGNTYYYLGDFKKAIEYHQMALSITKEVGNKAGEGCAYGNLGNAYHGLGDYRGAINYHERHLKISKEVGTVDGEGRAYGNLGNAYNSLGDYKKAVDCYQRHLKIAKEIGDRYGKGNAFYGLGCSFESLNSLAKAVDYFRSSIETYNDMRVYLRCEDEWKINLRNANQTAFTALVRALVKQDKFVEALFAAEQGRAQALIDIMESKYGFKTDHCESYPQQETDSNMLCEISTNTVFLAVVENNVFFWVCKEGQEVQFRMNEIVDHNSPENVTISSQSLVQKAYKEIGVGFGVKCEDHSLDKLDDEKLARESFDHKGAKSLQREKSSLETLYDVFIGPIAHLLKGQELIVVPEGPLCLAPFAAFLGPDSRYLCELFRIRVIPSLTTLKLIRDSPVDYHSQTGVLLVGDPWVQEVKDSKGGKIQQLPNAKKEVEMIGRILNVAPLTGANATKENVLMQLSSVALVHIAAHGNLNTGEIALTPNLVRKSPIPKVEDYLLRMPDIAQVHLRAKLVVLSCCHSGRGEVKAEGVVGIARAFLGAGARSVLVSLWEIDDFATLEFMKSFYQHLVNGYSASEALNRAMKWLRESDLFSEVKHWAPFALIGDDVTLDFGE